MTGGTILFLSSVFAGLAVGAVFWYIEECKIARDMENIAGPEWKASFGAWKERRKK